MKTKNKNDKVEEKFESLLYLTKCELEKNDDTIIIAPSYVFRECSLLTPSERKMLKEPGEFGMYGMFKRATIYEHMEKYKVDPEQINQFQMIFHHDLKDFLSGGIKNVIVSAHNKKDEN